MLIHVHTLQCMQVHQSACLLSLLILHRSGGCARVSGVSGILEMYEIEPVVAGIAHIHCLFTDIHTELCSLMYKETKSNLPMATFVAGL